MQVPLSTFYVSASQASTVALRIHTHVREDCIALYGFTTAAGAGSVRTADCDQRRRAEAGAGGAVGHRAGGAGARGAREDVARLTQIPGVGKKTAERIGLELKDRLPPTLASDREAGGLGCQIGCAPTCSRR